jgi:transcriptional regulator with XRE-family HTH domain
VTHRDTASSPPPRHATPLQRFGATLRQYRRQRGLSQKALAERTGIGYSYISQIERGKRNITLLALLRLAQALEMPAASLLVQLDPSGSHPAHRAGDPLPSHEARERAVRQATTSSLQPGDGATLLALLGATLRQSRQHCHLSLRALAARTGLRYSYICDIEQGHRNLSVLNLVRLTHALGLSVASVLAPLETSQRPASAGHE